MTVVLYEDRSLPKVAVNIWFHVGSKDERPGRTGFAHLFEHLMFMGTDRVPDNRYDLILEGGGAWSNASTSSDRTNYFCVGPSAMLPTMLWMEADRLDGLAEAMTQEKLDSQRDVVRNERREHENSPYGRSELLVGEVMYPSGHPYHHPIIGSHEDLEAATVEDVREFFRTYYVPSNATVVVAGDFDRKEVRPLVERTFGALPATSAPEHKTAPMPEMTGEIRRVETDNVEFPRLTLAWHSPPYCREGDGEMDLAASILASGSASRLEKRLVLDDRSAVNVTAYQASAELSSLFMIEATAGEDGDLNTIKRAILEELDRFVAEGPTAEEVARAKAQTEASFLRRMENLPSRADRINLYLHYFGVTDGFDRDLERWTMPDREAVRARAKQVFAGGRMDLRVLPATPDSLAARLDERPENFPAASFEPPAPESFTLSNGIEVHVITRPGSRLFSGQLIVPGGENQVDAARAGLMSLAGRMMNAGGGGRDASEFADAVESLGASMWVSPGRAQSTAVVSGISSRLGETLDLFADLVLRPNFKPADFEREKRIALARIRSRADNAEDVAQIVGRAMLFEASDPRSRPYEGTEETVSGLTLDDARGAAEGLFRPEDARFVFAGDFEVAELRDLLEDRFRKWKARGSLPEAPAMVPRASGGRFVLVDRPDAPQTVVYATRLVDRLDGVPRAIRTAANTIFGGSFTSRVNGNLREENGFTYGAYGRIADSPEYTFLYVTTDVFIDVTGQALVEMKRECDGMAAEPPTDEEVQKAIETQRANIVDTAETTRGAGQTLAELVRNGRRLDSTSRDLEALREVTPGDVREFARGGLWNWDGLNVVLVGNRDAVLAQLAESGFPAPELVDELGRPLDGNANGS
ncbi:insulinase family protein [bacterium]|nr:insulinase family protein [bacterium]